MQYALLGEKIEIEFENAFFQKSEIFTKAVRFYE